MTYFGIWDLGFRVKGGEGEKEKKKREEKKKRKKR